jgi:hypothetical protein
VLLKLRDRQLAQRRTGSLGRDAIAFAVEQEEAFLDPLGGLCRALGQSEYLREIE